MGKIWHLPMVLVPVFFMCGLLKPISDVFKKNRICKTSRRILVRVGFGFFGFFLKVQCYLCNSLASYQMWPCVVRCPVTYLDQANESLRLVDLLRVLKLFASADWEWEGSFFFKIAEKLFYKVWCLVFLWR